MSDDDLSPLAPLRRRVFRMLWLTWLMANVSMWMSDVASAWMMTSLNATPLWVAMVQTASTLPVFLLGLPSGAMADMLNRKTYLLSTQLWVAAVAALLSVVVFLDAMSPPVLLALTFANGIGLAMRWPVFSAIVPDLVPRPQLPAAIGLNGVAMNASRIIGPVAAGALIASAGTAWVFLFNALLSVASAFVISRWKYEHKPSALGRERLSSAMRVGLQYVWQSYHLKGVVLRISIMFIHSTALLALLPLVAQGMSNGGAGVFTLLLASMGAGAISATLVLPQLRRRFSRDQLVLRSTLVQAVAIGLVAWTHHTPIAMLAMYLNGMAWITAANTLSVSAQMGLPDWVRARGMALYQMALMGSSALGAALWGQVATATSVPQSLVVAAGSLVVCMWVALRRMPDSGMIDDLTPKRIFQSPQASDPPAQGHVMVQIEYQIDPARAAQFRRLMLEENRSSRLRHGALSWELLDDLNDPGRFIEIIVDESWTDHLRRFDRVTAADVALRDRKLAFHIGAEAPRVSRYLMASTVKND